MKKKKEKKRCSTYTFTVSGGNITTLDSGVQIVRCIQQCVKHSSKIPSTEDRFFFLLNLKSRSLRLNFTKKD